MKRLGQTTRKPPKGGWWKGDDLNAPGRYEVHLNRGKVFYMPGLSDPADEHAKEQWRGNVHFHGDKEKLEQGIEKTAWGTRYKIVPGAEARCRKAAEKAAATLQAYYERTGKRWEVLTELAYRKRQWMPKLPPPDAD